MDVRFRRGACCGSHHHVVQIKFRYRRPGAKTREREERSREKTKMDTEKLKSPELRSRFKQEMQKLIKAQEGQKHQSVQDHWQQSKTQQRQ